MAHGSGYLAGVGLRPAAETAACPRQCLPDLLRAVAGDWRAAGIEVTLRNERAICAAIHKRRQLSSQMRATFVE